MKKMLVVLGAAALFVSASASAQTISADVLKEIQSSYVNEGETAALSNVLRSESSINKLALNHELDGKIDHYFKYRVNVKGITNQKSSGRCWMFTSMNVLRPSIMEKFNVSNFDFSHNYTFFWDMFEKSNLFLENAIATAGYKITDREASFYFGSPVGDGGVWSLFYNLAEKYGVVPKSVMPETAHSDNTSGMRSIINERLRAGGYKLREMIAGGASKKEVQSAKVEILKDVYRVLALCLGEPPVSFEWRYVDKTSGEIKTLKSTPKEFYESIKPENYNPQNYIMIMNDPTREYFKVYEVANYRNMYEGVNWTFLNLPNDVIKKAAVASIKANEAMYASCDIIMFNTATGLCDPEMYDYETLFGIKLDMDKKARILTKESSSAHAMAIVAVDVDENENPVKWQFENSWGPTKGHNGYMTFTDKWFDEYMFRIVINKKYLDPKSIEAAKGKPIDLPAWDHAL